MRCTKKSVAEHYEHTYINVHGEKLIEILSNDQKSF